MTAAEKIAKVSLADYFALDAASAIKHEYDWGNVLAMAGASLTHNILTSNIIAMLHSQLRQRNCLTVASDMRLFVHDQMYTYPDVMVVCGKPHILHDYGDTLLNPTLIVEVLPPSTEQRDRGAKWLAYREIDSLQEYLMVHQDSPRVEHYERKAEGWLLRDAVGLDAHVSLRSIACSLPLANIYEKVTFDASESPVGDGLGGL